MTGSSTTNYRNPDYVVIANVGRKATWSDMGTRGHDNIISRSSRKNLNFLST